MPVICYTKVTSISLSLSLSLSLEIWCLTLSNRDKQAEIITWLFPFAGNGRLTLEIN